MYRFFKKVCNLNEFLAFLNSRLKACLSACLIFLLRCCENFCRIKPIGLKNPLFYNFFKTL